MSHELPADLDPRSDKLAKIGAVAGAFMDIGVDGVLENPDAVRGISDVIAESAEPASPERELFIEGVIKEVMDRHDVDREAAMKLILSELSGMLIDKLEELRQSQASEDTGSGYKEDK